MEQVHKPKDQHQVPRGKIGEPLQGIRLSEDFLNHILETQAIRTKSGKLDYIKLSNLWSAKATLTKAKSQPTKNGRKYLQTL